MYMSDKNLAMIRPLVKEFLFSVNAPWRRIQKSPLPIIPTNYWVVWCSGFLRNVRNMDGRTDGECDDNTSPVQFGTRGNLSGFSRKHSCSRCSVVWKSFHRGYLENLYFLECTFYVAFSALVYRSQSPTLAHEMAVLNSNGSISRTAGLSPWLWKRQAKGNLW
jgi:hypothetical protein